MKCDIARWNTSDIKTSEKCNKQQTKQTLLSLQADWYNAIYQMPETGVEKSVAAHS